MEDKTTYCYTRENAGSILNSYNCGEDHTRCRCLKDPRVFKAQTDTSPLHKIGFCISNQTPLRFSTAGINSDFLSSTGCNCVIVLEAVPDADLSSIPKVLIEDF